MRLLFCGTPGFAVPTLRHLLSQPGFQILAAITQPDRPRGRGQNLSLCPVKEAALAAGVAVFQPRKIRSDEAFELLQRQSPDAVVIIAYGQIIPQRLLSVPRLGWINLHASLLPKYRGAAPIQWAIARGENETGLTTMRIDAGLDTGDILLQERIEIGPDETSPQLSARMAELGGPLVAETLRKLAAGEIVPCPQDSSSASHAPILKKEDGRIDWTLPVEEIYNRMRGFAPWPGAYSSFRGQICHVWGRPESSGMAEAVTPGTILSKHGQLFVACGGRRLLKLDSIQLEGRKRISALEFANGARLRPEERFGPRFPVWS